MDLTIVIPTYNEKDSVRMIVNRIRRVMNGQGRQYEILFVDDSSDDTPLVLQKLALRYPEVRCLHRVETRGLASAVVEGFRLAQGNYIVVMDADLQHPPEVIPLILQRLSFADVVIPSRFIEGGSDGGLNWFRKWISWTARSVGRLSIQKLRGISDCTSGFFGLNRSVIQDADLNPIGWKILMEVLVKGNYRTVHEIPYTFVARDAGQSKMNLREQWNYLQHIIRLVAGSPDDRRFFSFCLVGFLGVFVNLLCLKLFLNFSAMDQLTASGAASLLAMVHNFLWNNQVTWKGRPHAGPWQSIRRFPQFLAVCSLGIVVTALSAQSFAVMGWSVYAGQLFGICISTYGTFVANNRWTWGDAAEEDLPLTVTVTQECALQRSQDTEVLAKISEPWGRK